MPNASLLASFNQAIADASIGNPGVASTWGLLSGAEYCNDTMHINAMSQTELAELVYELAARVR